MAEEEPTIPDDSIEPLADAPLESTPSAEVDRMPPQPAPPVEYERSMPEPYTDWGPPGAGRYFVAFLVLIGITAVGLAVVWVLWGRQLWETFTGDWT